MLYCGELSRLADDIEVIMLEHNLSMLQLNPALPSNQDNLKTTKHKECQVYKHGTEYSFGHSFTIFRIIGRPHHRLMTSFEQVTNERKNDNGK